MSSKKFKIVHRIPNSNILIDYWKHSAQNKYHRFMTYLRIDANDESIKDICESTYTIYTSLFNKWYLVTYYQVSEHRLIELRVNETQNFYDIHSNSTFSVTAFDANYYTGSLMFLFQGSFGKILYTGFFRPSSFDPIFQVPLLKSIVDKRELDVAYIDNTYAAEHCEFPTRSEVISQIILCLRQNPKHKVAISGKRLGKEEILLDIAKALDEKICVSEEKFVILSRLSVQKYFTTDKRKSRIYAYDYIINPREIIRRQTHYGPYIVILLTAFYHCDRSTPAKDLDIPGLYIFPYSGHCSHSELVRFISHLRPRNVEPILEFENTELPNSIIPPCIYKLCHKPLSFPDSLMLSNSERQVNPYASNEEIMNVFNMPAAITENETSPENQVIANDASNTPNSDLRYLEGIEEFFESVSSGNNGSKFENTVNDSMISVNTMSNTSCESPGVSCLNNPMLDNVLNTSKNIENKTLASTSISEFNRVTQNEIIVQSVQTSSSMIDNAIHQVDLIQMLEQDTVDTISEMKLDFPITTSLPNTDTCDTYHTACSQQSNENVISTSCTTPENAVMENIDEVHVLQNPPQKLVYPSSTYTENEIAENIISSTNNENFTEAIFPVEKTRNYAETSPITTDGNNFNNIKDLSLQKAEIDSPIRSETEQANTQLENNDIPQQVVEVLKIYENKSTETDLTLEKLNHLEETAKSAINCDKKHCMNQDVKQRMVNYLSTNQKSKFNANMFYNRYRQKTRRYHDDKTCTVSNCEECECTKQLELNKKKRKIINSTLYNYSLSLKPSFGAEEWSNLNGCNILSHPIFKNVNFNK